MRRKSDSEKILNGTFKKSRGRKLERMPEMRIEDIPEPADHLSRRGAEIYYSVCHHLNSYGLLNPVVAMQVNIFATHAEQCEENMEMLEQEGELTEVSGKNNKIPYYKINPRVRLLTQHSRNMLAWAKQLNLCPIDADRLPAPDEIQDNPFTKL